MSYVSFMRIAFVASFPLHTGEYSYSTCVDPDCIAYEKGAGYAGIGTPSNPLHAKYCTHCGGGLGARTGSKLIYPSGIFYTRGPKYSPFQNGVYSKPRLDCEHVNSPLKPLFDTALAMDMPVGWVSFTPTTQVVGELFQFEEWGSGHGIFLPCSFFSLEGMFSQAAQHVPVVASYVYNTLLAFKDGKYPPGFELSPDDVVVQIAIHADTSSDD